MGWSKHVESSDLVQKWYVLHEVFNEYVTIFVTESVYVSVYVNVLNFLGSRQLEILYSSVQR